MPSSRQHGRELELELAPLGTLEIELGVAREVVVAAQLDAVFDDFEVAAIKIGMLATPGIVRVVASAIAVNPKIPVVLDPVLVATVGAKLAADGLVPALRRELLARADLLTPNVPEAESLLGERIRDARDLADAAAALVDGGARAVLLKGGHLRGERVADLFLERGAKPVWFRHARIAVEGHGTGCTLSSAIAARLALGDAMRDAVAAGIAFVHRGLRGAYRPGRGTVHVLDSFAAPARR